MKTFKLTKIAALTLLMGSANAMADSVTTQMDNAFNSMINTTSAKAYNTARRGVITGGQLFVRNETKRTNVLSATAPSISAGCGGIDLYGGSFSYINADQMVQTFQAIGANAISYGVKLAIEAACPSCEQVMTSLEKTAQAINALNIDSCNAAQGLVNAASDFSTSSMADVAAKTASIASGTMDDISQAWTWASTEGNSATNELKSNDPTTYKNIITGNIAWKAFKQSNLTSVFTGDDKMLRMLMTLTGSVIIKNVDTATDTDPSPTTLNGYGIKLSELINGGTFNIYTCSDGTGATACLTVPTTPNDTITDSGFKSRIDTALTGTDGMIAAMQGDTEWSANAKKALQLPTLVGSVCLKKIRQAVLAKQVTIATDIANLCSERMALEVAYSQVNQYFDATLTALSNQDASTAQQAAKEKAIEVLKDSQQKYTKEYNELTDKSDVLKILTALQAIEIKNDGANSIVGGVN